MKARAERVAAMEATIAEAEATVATQAKALEAAQQQSSAGGEDASSSSGPEADAEAEEAAAAALEAAKVHLAELVAKLAALVAAHAAHDAEVALSATGVGGEGGEGGSDASEAKGSLGVAALEAAYAAAEAALVAASAALKAAEMGRAQLDEAPDEEKEAAGDAVATAEDGVMAAKAAVKAAAAALEAATDSDVGEVDDARAKERAELVVKLDVARATLKQQTDLIDARENEAADDDGDGGGGGDDDDDDLTLLEESAEAAREAVEDAETELERFDAKTDGIVRESEASWGGSRPATAATEQSADDDAPLTGHDMAMKEEEEDEELEEELVPTPEPEEDPVELLRRKREVVEALQHEQYVQADLIQRNTAAQAAIAEIFRKKQKDTKEETAKSIGEQEERYQKLLTSIEQVETDFAAKKKLYTEEIGKVTLRRDAVMKEVEAKQQEFYAYKRLIAKQAVSHKTGKTMKEAEWLALEAAEKEKESRVRQERLKYFKLRNQLRVREVSERIARAQLALSLSDCGLALSPTLARAPPQLRGARHLLTHHAVTHASCLHPLLPLTCHAATHASCFHRCCCHPRVMLPLTLHATAAATAVATPATTAATCHVVLEAFTAISRSTLLQHVVALGNLQLKQHARSTVVVCGSVW
jgi:hypothetical protein